LVVGSSERKDAAVCRETAGGDLHKNSPRVFIMTRAIELSLVALTSAFVVQHASADLIAWGAVQDATGPAEVSLNGTLVAARNCWSSSGGFVSPVVNGVTFDAFAPLGWNSAGWDLMHGSTSGDAGYDTMLSDARATSEPIGNPTGWGAVQLDTLAPLTLGAQYEIQVWYSDQRPGTASNVLNDRVMNCSSATGLATLVGGVVTNLGALTQGSVAAGLDADPNNIAGVGDTLFGQYVVGTFTRTSADPLYLLIQGTHPIPTNNLLTHLNSFQVRELPGYTNFCFGDGTGITCPCGNLGGAGEGCLNSSFVGGATLNGAGIASLANDTFTLAVDGVPGDKPGLILRGANQTAGVLAGDGILCTTGNTARSHVQVTVGGSTLFTNFQGSGFGASSNGAGVPTNYQFWYRDPAGSPCGSSFNFSNGVSAVWAP
jgi:hypothetical protein